MCGIVGAIRSNANVVDFLTDGLKRLEYRGYDSSGIAVQTDNGLKRVRRVGKLGHALGAHQLSHDDGQGGRVHGIQPQSDDG